MSTQTPGNSSTELTAPEPQEATVVLIQETQQTMRAFGRRLLVCAVVAFTVISLVLLLSLALGPYVAFRSGQAIDYVQINKSMQVTMGMICGLLLAFFGVALSWAGIAGSVSGTFGSGKFSASISTASPGVVLVVSGTILLGVCVTREVHTETPYQTTRSTYVPFYDVNPLDTQSTDGPYSDVEKEAFDGKSGLDETDESNTY